MATLVRASCKICRISKSFIRPISTSSRLSVGQDKQADQEIHTGQKWEEGDYRMVRYVDRAKTVNTRFAADLVQEVAPQACADRVVSCDGGGGPLGHPKVYINLDQAGNHSCGYCGLRFYKEDHH